MKKERVNLIPKYEMKPAMYRAVNEIAGATFNNEEIRVDVGAICHRFQQQDFILLSLKHVGIEAELYVSLSEVGRLLGLDMKHFEQDYLSYVMAQVISQYGLAFKSYPDFDIEVSTLLMSCQLIFGAYNISALLKVDTLIIDSNYLKTSLSSLPRTLVLIASCSIFKTSLSVEEILSLTNNDLVLVFPK
jgi:hypothetical protein